MLCSSMTFTTPYIATAFVRKLVSFDQFSLWSEISPISLMSQEKAKQKRRFGESYCLLPRDEIIGCRKQEVSDKLARPFPSARNR